MSEVPDFTHWSRHRLETLLEEYRETFDSIQRQYGRRHSEYQLYLSWITGIEKELERRDSFT